MIRDEVIIHGQNSESQSLPCNIIYLFSPYLYLGGNFGLKGSSSFGSLSSGKPSGSTTQTCPSPNANAFSATARPSSQPSGSQSRPSAPFSSQQTDGYKPQVFTQPNYSSVIGDRSERGTRKHFGKIILGEGKNENSLHDVLLFCNIYVSLTLLSMTMHVLCAFFFHF